MTRSNRPVVHVTQGTIRPDLTELVVPTLRGLADEDVLVVVKTGGAGATQLETAYGAPLPANARIAPFIPYDLLLRNVSAVVTNGGYTGVTLARDHLGRRADHDQRRRAEVG